MSADSAPQWPSPDVRFADLVEGFRKIGDLPIPFASLPGRARKAYPGFYRLWSDLADVTIADLLAHKPGERTVAALVIAARQEVAAYRKAKARKPASPVQACARLLDALDVRDRLVVTGRIIAREPTPQVEVARQAGVNNATWVVRHQSRIAARVGELLDHPAHADVIGYAEQLRTLLGSYAPASAADAALLHLGVQPISVAADLLLYAAGPYIPDAPDGLWVGIESGRERVEAARDRLYKRVPAPDTAALLTVLTKAGMAAHVVPAYLASLNLARIDGKYVWWSDRLTEQIEAILHAWGRPATAADIHRKLGRHAADSVVHTLGGTAKFKRITRTTWGLSAWDMPSYSSISDAIGARIDAAGGEIASDELVAAVCADIHDVTELSVRSYIGSLAFINVNGMVRRRRADDPLPRVPALNKVRGVFRQGDNIIRLGMVVNADALRGSGQALPASVSVALGVDAGQRRAYRTRFGTLVVTWRLNSTSASSIGSVRKLGAWVSNGLGGLCEHAVRSPDRHL